MNFETDEEIKEDLINKRISGYNKQSEDSQSVMGEIITSTGETLSKEMDLIEKEIIERRINMYLNMKHKDIVKNVCKDLNISRTTLYRRLNKYQICINNETVPLMKQ